MTVYLAIDFGGTRTKLGVFDINGILVERVMLPVAPSFDLTMSNIGKITKELIQAHSYSVKSVGISFAALVDPVQKKVIDTNGKHAGASAFQFDQWVENQWGCNFAIDNDSRLACLGEWKHGAGYGYDNVVCITLGTGLGTGVVLQSRLLRGRHYSAGSLGGHFTIDYTAKECNCGNRGCVESIASGWKLSDILKDFLGEKTQQWLKRHKLIGTQFGYKELFSLSGDPTAKKIIDYLNHVWGVAAVNMIHAYDPEIVVFSGGTMHDYARILPAIERYVEKYSWTPMHQVKIDVAKYIDDSSLYGIYTLLTEGDDYAL